MDRCTRTEADNAATISTENATTDDSDEKDTEHLCNYERVNYGTVRGPNGTKNNQKTRRTFM